MKLGTLCLLALGFATPAFSATCAADLFDETSDGGSPSGFFATLGAVTSAPQDCEEIQAIVAATLPSGDQTNNCDAAAAMWRDQAGDLSESSMKLMQNRLSHCPELVAVIDEILNPKNVAPPLVQWQACTPLRHTLATGKLCVETALPGQSGNRYGPDNLFDENLRTAWVEGVMGHGDGQQLIVVFDEMITVNALRLRNGYLKSESLFQKNSRVREIAVTNSYEQTYRFDLLDEDGWQELSFDTPKPVSWIALEVVGVYPGSKYQDTAITELRVD